MKMSVSVNNQSGVPYVQYGTDRQKAKATKFVQANDKELNQLAYKINNRKHRDNKFAQNVAKAVLALPVVAGVAAAITTKGKVSSKTLGAAKAGIKTAASIAVPLMVLDANNVIASKKPSVRKAENKHPLLTLTGLTAVATGAVVGLEAIAQKVSPRATAQLKTLGKKIKLDKLAAKMDAAPEAIKGVASKLSEKISLPKGVKERLSSISSKVKMPQILKDGYNKIANAEVTKNAAMAMKKMGSKMLKNPVSTAMVAIGVALVGNAVKRSVELSATKSMLKADQMKTANALINAYAAENESLKSANAKVANNLEKANDIIAEENTKTDVE